MAATEHAEGPLLPAASLARACHPALGDRALTVDVAVGGLGVVRPVHPAEPAATGSAEDAA